MQKIIFKVTVVVAVFGMFGIYAGGAANLATAQTQNSTSSQIGSVVDKICASAMNSTTMTASANQTTAYVTNKTTTTAMNSNASMGATNTTTASTDSDGMLDSALRAKLLQSVANAKMYLHDACRAIQNNDLQGAMGYLVVVEREIYGIEGNVSSTDAARNSTGTTSSSTQQQNQTGTNDPFAGLRDLFGG
jgi:hypothetical protein